MLAPTANLKIVVSIRLGQRQSWSIPTLSVPSPITQFINYKLYLMRKHLTIVIRLQFTNRQILILIVSLLLHPYALYLKLGVCYGLFCLQKVDIFIPQFINTTR